MRTSSGGGSRPARAARLALAALAAALAALPALSCRPGGGPAAVLWTDRPELAFYAGLFNASQDRYRVEALHFDSPAQRLAGLGPPPGRGQRGRPDIVVASWLLGESEKPLWRPLDERAGGGPRVEAALYPRLLAMGRRGGRQYLLPVSFNAPLAAFARGGAPATSCPLTLGLAEMRELSGGFNAPAGGPPSRMGFSPDWDDGFMLVAAALMGASFREADPVAWDAGALARAAQFAREWTGGVNPGAEASADFAFRFMNAPPASLALSGRVLFAHMDSAAFFALPEARRGGLDFRWLAEGGQIPLGEGAAFLGLPRGGEAPGAAAAFVRWLFSADAQREILESSHKLRQTETSFGIAGGFSALRAVTEQDFPRIYPDLLGRVPPGDFLAPAAALPRDWPAMRDRVVLPYLREASSAAQAGPPLESRLADWARLNRH